MGGGGGGNLAFLCPGFWLSQVGRPVIYDMLNGHRQFNMYKMITDFGHMLECDVLDLFLRYKAKYALQEGYHGVM